MRLLLIIALVNGLVPALGELAEAAVHFAVEGHLVHTAADQGDLGDLGHEHGCGTTEHHCSCCASQAAVSAPGGGSLVINPPDAPVPGRLGPLASLHEPAPPYRPPISS